MITKLTKNLISKGNSSSKSLAKKPKASKIAHSIYQRVRKAALTIRSVCGPYYTALKEDRTAIDTPSTVLAPSR